MSDVAALSEAEQLLAEVEHRPRRFGCYESYKPSDARWMSDIPQHWDIRRLKHVARVNPTKSEISGLAGDDLASFVPMEAIREFGGMTLEDTRPIEEVSQGYTYFCDGDVVIAKITPCFENGKGSVAADMVNGVGFGTTELHVIRPRSAAVDRVFLFYLTMSEPFRKLGTGEMYGAGGQKRVPDSFIKDFRTPIPPLDEQRAIARFLDRETAKIDSLVAKKRRLIELLGEKRTALISHAVTKGLNPDAPTKPSGIDWLGDVPAHWEVLPIKRCCQIRGGQVDPRDPEFSGLTLIAPDHIESLTGRLIMRETAVEQAAISGKYMFQPGDVLYSKIRPELAKAVIGDEVGLCSADMYAMVPNHRCIGRYLLRLILSDVVTKMTVDESLRVAMPKVNRLTLGRIPVPLPPTDEQEVIADHVEMMANQIDGLCDRICGVIASVNEYRSALISAAVTGQIDVRKEIA